MSDDETHDETTASGQPETTQVVWASPVLDEFTRPNAPHPATGDGTDLVNNPVEATRVDVEPTQVTGEVSSQLAAQLSGDGNREATIVLSADQEIVGARSEPVSGDTTRPAAATGPGPGPAGPRPDDIPTSALEQAAPAEPTQASVVVAETIPVDASDLPFNRRERFVLAVALGASLVALALSYVWGYLSARG